MNDFNEMGKKELRAECKQAGVKGYSKMTVAAMREELFKTYATAEEEVIGTPVIGEFVHCPHCGIHLDNGYGVDDGEGFEVNGVVHFHKQYEFACLACDGEFGPEVVHTTKGNGLKIEKDRPEQNGVTRPSEGGKCRAIWDACDAYYAEHKMVPMPKQMKAMAADKGWNENNAVIEMYQWRKFHGFTGRQK